MKPNPANVIRFSAEEFGEMFPFYVAFGPDGVVTDVGRSMRQLSPAARPGARVDEILRPHRPEEPLEFARLEAGRHQLYIVREVATGTLLRGQMQRLGGAMYFLGSPWLPSTAALSALGLTLRDFAVHDPTLDLLQLLQSHEIAARDLRQLTDRLTAQGVELQESARRAQQKEEESRTLAVVAARTDNAVVLTDARGRIEWVNDGFTRMTGYTLAECAGRTPGSFLQGPGTDPAVVQHMRRQLAAGQGFKVELINYHKDGHYYWAATHVQPILDAAGRLAHFMAIESDITTRRQTENHLRTQFGVARELVESQTLNEAGAAILRTVGREMDWTVGAFWLVDSLQARLECVEVWWPEGEPGIGEFVAGFRGRQFARGEALPGRAWQEGRSLWLRDVPSEPSFKPAGAAHTSGLHCGVAVPVAVAGQVIGVIEFLSKRVEEPDDVRLSTLNAVSQQFGQFIEHLRTGEALRTRSEELERANVQLAEAARMKDAFLASMNHELRTPLTGILGMTETLLDNGAGPLNDKQVQYLKIVETSGRHLLELINDILDLAKLQAGLQHLAKQPCLAQQFCESSLRTVKGIATRRRQKMTLTNDAVGVRVRVDSRRMVQVLVNLLSNAAKFTPEGGEFGLHASVHGEELHLVVWDRGIGIAPADLARLFQPFTQLDARLSRRYEGTGLGLALVKKLVELHGGTVSVTSELAAGSQFTIRLPLAAADEPAVSDSSGL